jgi:hypothetical protein
MTSFTDYITCKHCGRVARGRRGRKYCSSRCRLAAYRVASRGELSVSSSSMLSGEHVGAETAPAHVLVAEKQLSEAREMVDLLKRLRFVGRISPTNLALLVPRGIALDELNLDRQHWPKENRIRLRFSTARAHPISDADLVRALRDLHIEDYPQRAPSHAGRMLLREEETAPAKTLLPEGSYRSLEAEAAIEYDENGFPELPACLDRRRPTKLEEAA